MSIDLGLDEDLVVIQTHLLAAKRNVEAVMGLMYLSGSQTAMVMGTTDEERLTIGGPAGEHSVSGHVAVTVVNPTITVSGQQLIVMLHHLPTAVGHVGTSLARNHL